MLVGTTKCFKFALLSQVALPSMGSRIIELICLTSTFRNANHFTHLCIHCGQPRFGATKTHRTKTVYNSLIKVLTRPLFLPAFCAGATGLSLKLALRLKLIGDVVRRDDTVGLIVRLPSNVFFRLTALTKVWHQAGVRSRTAPSHLPPWRQRSASR